MALLLPPPEGDCVTPDGHINPAFDHAGTHGQGTRVASAKARAICEGCPVLVECQQWAANFSDWSAVTVAGWTASAQVASAPPWAPPLEGRKYRPSLVKIRRPRSKNVA